MKFRLRVSDGRTQYEVLTGHGCKHPVLRIGEVVACRLVVDTARGHTADGDLQEGVCLLAWTQRAHTW